MTLTFKANKLVIRPLAKRDYKIWKQAFLNSSLNRNVWDHSNPLSKDLHYNYFLKNLKAQKTQREKDQTYIFGVFLQSTGEYVGEISVVNVIRGKIQTASLGISLLNKYWGRGFGKDIGQVMPRLVFRELGLHRVEGGIEPRNRRSLMLAKSIGMKREGLKRKAAFLRGEWVDLVLMGATSEDFGIKWQPQ